MHEDIEEIIEIPEGVFASKNSLLNIKGKEGEVKRKIHVPYEIEENKIILKAKNSTKNKKRMIMAEKAHISNMIKGVQKKFEYILQICFIHFPMTIKLEGKKLIIKNFLGESKERKANIRDNVEVKIEGDKIKVFSVDKEAAGQTAATIESATKVKNKDRRIFQDGIWIIKTPDKEY